ncbi:MAG: hypothetical protein FWC41_00360 [Firmicutes bacterium]|nr:hypothetical protein [Bacillota bacterium]
MVKNLFVFFFINVKTEEARFVSFDLFLDTEIVVIRDEIVLKSDSDFTKIIVKDGARVAKGETLAYTYDSDEELKNSNRLKEIENKIFYINSFSNRRLYNLSSLNSQIVSIIRNLSFKDLSKKNEQLIYLISQRELFLKNDIKTSSNLNSLINEKNKINLSSRKEIKSEYNSFFSSSVDNFENLNQKISDDEIKNFDFKKINKSSSQKKNSIGKIVTSPKCLILCKVQDISKVENKKHIYIKLNLNSKNLLKCNVKKKIDNIIVAECDINNTLINLRSEKAKLKTKEVEGIQVLKRAIKNIDNSPGVFIKDRKTLKFKKIKAIYEKDKYVICNINEKDPDSLQKDDLIVVSGRNMYDGKII